MKKKYSIFIKCAAVMSVVVLIEIIIFICTSAASGVLNSINSGEEELLCRYAGRGGTYIRNEMLKSAASADSAAARVNGAASDLLKKKGMSAEDLFVSQSLVNEYLDGVSGELLEYLRINQADGVFVILCSSAAPPDESAGARYKGVFFKDSDVTSSPEDHSDIMLLRGSSTISSHYKIPLDMSWNSEFECGSADAVSFFSEPVKAAYRYPDSSYDSLGYWSGRFTLSGNDEYDDFGVISYSVPLVLDGQVYGAFGVCLSPDRLISLLPSDDPSGAGYMLVTAEDAPDGDAFTVRVHAFSGTRLAADAFPGRQYRLSEEKSSRSLYCIKNLDIDNQNEYCAVGAIDVYEEASPFSGSEWMLLSTDKESTLFGASRKLEGRLFSAVAISAVIGVILSLVAAKTIFSPIEQLASEAANMKEGDVIPVRENADKEITDISAALNRLSSAQKTYLTELSSEKERYMTALRAVKSDIFEYDYKTDVFTMYRFSAGGSEEESRSVHENFRSVVENGKVCPIEDIPNMLSFMDGNAPERFVIRTFRQDGSVRWNDVRVRRVCGSDGEYIRAFACSSDITKEKEEELKKLDCERRDGVTGVYNGEYGMLMAERDIFERNKGEYTLAVIYFRGTGRFIEKFGEYCFNGVLEDAGKTAVMCAAENDVLWRNGRDEIIAYIPEASSDKLWDRIERFLAYIRQVYYSDDINDGIFCRIGVSSNKQGAPIAKALEKARKAALSGSSSSIDYYNGSEYKDKDAPPEPPAPDDVSGEYVLTDNIISYALTVLGKASDMRRSVNTVMRKAIRVLGLERAAFYDAVPENDEFRLYTRCSAFGLDNGNTESFRLSAEDYEAVKKYLESEEMLIAGKDFYINSGTLYEAITKFRGNGCMIMLPVTETLRFNGCMIFSAASEERISVLKETLYQLSKILSAYVVKSRAKKDSRAKSDLISKMSDDIRVPVREIIEKAESIIGNDTVSGDAEEALLAIKRSADALNRLIEDLPIQKEKGKPKHGKNKNKKK